MKYCPACRDSFDLDSLVLTCAQFHVQEFCKKKAVTLAVLDKAKAVLLEHDVPKFAATALGQVFKAMYGGKVSSSASHCLCFYMLAVNVKGLCAQNCLGPSMYTRQQEQSLDVCAESMTSAHAEVKVAESRALPRFAPLLLPPACSPNNAAAMQVAGFVMDSCSDSAPSSGLSAVLQEFKEVCLQCCMAVAMFFPAGSPLQWSLVLQELLAHKAHMLRCHNSTLQKADMQAAEQAQTDAEVGAPDLGTFCKPVLTHAAVVCQANFALRTAL